MISGEMPEASSSIARWCGSNASEPSGAAPGKEGLWSDSRRCILGIVLSSGAGLWQLYRGGMPSRDGALGGVFLLLIRRWLQCSGYASDPSRYPRIDPSLRRQEGPPGAL